MGYQGDSFMKKTQKGFSILAFETTKQSRILKKRMRTAALQKEVKADLRDLGNLIYNAIINGQSGVLEEEEVKILVENIRENKSEVERLRDSIARLNRTRKHFDEQQFEYEPEPQTAPSEVASAEAEVAPAAEPEPVPETAPVAPPATEEAVKEQGTEPILEPDISETGEKPEGARRAPKKVPPRSKKKEKEPNEENNDSEKEEAT